MPGKMSPCLVFPQSLGVNSGGIQVSNSRCEINVKFAEQQVVRRTVNRNHVPNKMMSTGPFCVLQ